MSDDERLRLLIRAEQPVIADAGFARDVSMQIDQRRRRRRVVLGGAALIGAMISVHALFLVGREFATVAAALPPLAGSLVGVAALCAAVLSLWIVSVGVEE